MGYMSTATHPQVLHNKGGNMSDVFRKVYQPLSEEQKAIIEGIKEKAQGLYDYIDASNSDPRMKALAKTKLEESVMWVVKGITS